MEIAELEQFRSSLEELRAAGGPEPHQYEVLMSEIVAIHKNTICGLVQKSEIRPILESCGELFSLKTIHGFVLRKPRGYAGDFEIIDKLYRKETSADPALEKWDLFLHSQPSSRALLNRKTYFQSILDSLPSNASVLKLGCGPGRGMYEWLSRNPDSSISFECLDIDKDAIDFASNLNRKFQDRITFHNGNVFKFFPQENQEYDLIWAAGLFDYFDDKSFVALGRRFFKFLKPGGQLVIGNFSPNNPTRSMMEIFGEWYLNYRDENQLAELGTQISDTAKIDINSEPERVNLFLHLARA